QTLTDLVTIYREKGRLRDLTIGFCGDLKYGRTVHSLIAALARYENIKIVLISPEELRLPGYVLHGVLEENGMDFTETDSLDASLPELDILYMTRVQRERFVDLDQYEQLKDLYILTPEKMELAKKDMCILHPLPRVNEISVAIDADPRACYFKQVLNGKLVRMALIRKLLSEADRDVTPDEEGVVVNTYRCTNPVCISATEQELPQKVRLVSAENQVYRCIYCEKNAHKED
ncbi:MAG: aspartate carbamoyltransferase, partial [Oscillospiraceae bacterium]|nr:aspartate carbamoyltransferase [Oscillospiraceae bacterium]